jgi:hypothetical protein
MVNAERGEELLYTDRELFPGDLYGSDVRDVTSSIIVKQEGAEVQIFL